MLKTASNGQMFIYMILLNKLTILALYDMTMGHRLLLYELDLVVKNIYFYVWDYIQWLFCDRRTMYK
jgi:hypothetical protein